MKKLWILLICLFFVPSLGYPVDDTYDSIGQYNSGLESGTYPKSEIKSGTYLEKDRWETDRINIKSGLKTEGYIKKDKWEKDRLNFYDKNGKKTATYLEKDKWQKQKWNIKKRTF